MTERWFDEATRSVAAGASRRGVLRGLLGGALAGGMTWIGSRRAEAGARPGPGAACFKKGRRCRYDRQGCSGRCREGVCAGPPNLSRCRPNRPNRPPCTPNCAGRQCGPDGCGGTCGGCLGGLMNDFCVDGTCQGCIPGTTIGCPEGQLSVRDPQAGAVFCGSPA